MKKRSVETAGQLRAAFLGRTSSTVNAWNYNVYVLCDAVNVLVLWRSSSERNTNFFVFTEFFISISIANFRPQIGSDINRD